MGFPFAAVFKLAAQFVPGEIGKAIAKAEDDVTSGADKKTKAINIALDSLHGFNSVIAGVDATAHPELVSKVGKVNDAIVELANAITAVASQAKIPPPALPQADGSGN